MNRDMYLVYNKIFDSIQKGLDSRQKQEEESQMNHELVSEIPIPDWGSALKVRSTSFVRLLLLAIPKYNIFRTLPLCINAH